MKIKYFDRAIEWLFFALMFLSPVIFDRRIGIVFSGTKSWIIRLFLLIILTIWAIKLLVGGRHNFKRTILDWPILSYLLCITAATITSLQVLISFFGFYGRYEGLITWYSYALMFFIAVNYLRGFDKLKNFIALIIPVSTAMSIYGVIQRQGTDPYVWGGVVTWQRVIATIGQPNFLAAYVCMAFFILMFFILTHNNSGNNNVLHNEKKNKKNMLPQKQGLGDIYFISETLLPVVYYFAVPLLFIVMIYSQSGQNVFFWYLFFAAMTFAGLRFAYTYNKLPDIVLKVLVLISLGLNYICLFYTQSRGGYLGFAVGMVLLIVFIPRKRFLSNWKILLALAVIISVITIATAIDPDFSPFARFGSEIKTNTDVSSDTADKPDESGDHLEFGGAAGSRGETWKSALGIIADMPVFGAGPEVLKMVFPRYETNLFRFKEGFHVKQDRCHNETFDVPATKGLIAFFVYIFILFLVFQYGFRKIKVVDDDKKVFLVALLAAITSYLIQNQFSFGVVAITSLFWVMWALIMNIESNPFKEDEREITFENIPWFYAAVLLVVVFILGYVFILQFEADKYFKTGKNYMDFKRYEESLSWFKKSLDTFPIEGGTITYQGISTLNSSFSAKPEDRDKILEKSLQIFKYGMQVDPYNADNLYITARIYMIKGDAKKAEEFTRKALKIDPYYAEAHLILASIKEMRGDFKAAQADYKEANRINPNLVEPKIKIAFEQMSQGNFQEAFKIFQDVLVIDPKNIQVHNGLGAIYAKTGNSPRAKEEFEQVLELDPNNAYAKMMLKK